MRLVVATQHRPHEVSALAPVQASSAQPVQWWAIVGGAFLAFYAYLIIAWVSGPNFTSVPSGPDSPPGWMSAVQVSWQAIGIPLTGFLLYRVLIRPWRRDGRPS